MRIKSRDNLNLEISAFRGHFATRHSHNSHYLDITRMKHEYGMAVDAADILVRHYIYEKQIDTIVCMDGSSGSAHLHSTVLYGNMNWRTKANESLLHILPHWRHRK